MKVMVETSAHHVHVTKETLEALFGKGATLTNKKNLSQPGQFACVEKVTVVGPKSEMKMSILGPERSADQVEISLTDARKLGIAAPVRESGDIAGTPGCKLVGPEGEVEIECGVIAAKRHIHLDPKTAEEFGLKDKQLIEYRRHDIGFVFQFYNLVHNLTAKENVELAAQICSNPLDSKTALESVGLLERANNFPAQLSGGEQQRVSIARALAKRPKLLLCDEPTGALDYNTGRQILKLLQETCRKDKMTVVLITHNGAITPMADHILRMKSGKIVEDIYNENPKNVEEIEW